MKKIILIVSILMLLFPVVSALDVDMNSDKDQVDIGETFIVSIKINTDEKVSCWSINELSFSNAEVLNIEINDIWKADGFYDNGTIDNENNKISLVGAFLMNSYIGELYLCNITFEGETKGDCTIVVDDSYIRRPNNKPFTYVIDDLEIQVGEDDGGNGGNGGGNGGYNPPPPPKNKPPIANFTIEGNLTTNHTIYFNSTSYDEDGEIIEFQWTVFDNTSEIYEKNITMNFTIPFNYSISLIVTDNDGDSDSITKSITIEEEVYIPNQDLDNDTNQTNGNQTNNTEPPDQNQTNGNQSTDAKDDDSIIISYEPLVIMIIAIIVVVIIYIKYRLEEKK